MNKYIVNEMVYDMKGIGPLETCIQIAQELYRLGWRKPERDKDIEHKENNNGER